MDRWAALAWLFTAGGIVLGTFVGLLGVILGLPTQYDVEFAVLGALFACSFGISGVALVDIRQVGTHSESTAKAMQRFESEHRTERQQGEKAQRIAALLTQIEQSYAPGVGAGLVEDRNVIVIDQERAIFSSTVLKLRAIADGNVPLTDTDTGRMYDIMRKAREDVRGTVYIPPGGPLPTPWFAKSAGRGFLKDNRKLVDDRKVVRKLIICSQADVLRLEELVRLQVATGAKVGILTPADVILIEPVLKENFVIIDSKIMWKTPMEGESVAPNVLVTDKGKVDDAVRIFDAYQWSTNYHEPSEFFPGITPDRTLLDPKP
jgi:hypothetical protein